MKQKSLFDDISIRMDMRESIALTQSVMQDYGQRFDQWQIAWSGGKDSTATLTLIVWMIESGMIPRPKKLSVLYADTRMELPPLYISAMALIDDLKERGIDVKVVTAPIQKRYLPYILGRGVPPPNNKTLRWCTRQIKIEPMKNAVEKEGWLTITGVRIGESAARDERIVLSCSKDGAECGQGHFFQGLTNTLAPIVHWRVCHVWEWLKHWAPLAQYGDWDTSILADAYGGDEAEEVNARTGCICCPLASNDRALDKIISNPKWAYLVPLKELRGIYLEMRSPIHRLRKSGEERNKNGKISKNPNRMGPLTIKARMKFFDQILDIQKRINDHSVYLHKIDLLNSEEIKFITKCWDLKIFPDGWKGNEPMASDLYEEHFSDGTVQKLLFKY